MTTPLETTLTISAIGVAPDVVAVIRSALLTSMRDASAPLSAADASLDWPKFCIYDKEPLPVDAVVQVSVMTEAEQKQTADLCDPITIIVKEGAEAKPRLDGVVIYTTSSFALPKEIADAYGKRIPKTESPAKRFLVILWFALSRTRTVMRFGRLALHFQRLMAERAVFGFPDLLAVSMIGREHRRGPSMRLTRAELALSKNSPLFGFVWLEAISRQSFRHDDGGAHARALLGDALKIASAFFHRPPDAHSDALRIVFEIVPDEAKALEVYKQLYFTRESDQALHCYVCRIGSDVEQNIEEGMERVIRVPSHEWNDALSLGMRLVDFVSQRMMLFSATPLVKTDKTESVAALVSDKPWIRALKPVVERQDSNEILPPRAALSSMATFSKAVVVASTDAFEKEATELMGPTCVDVFRFADDLEYDEDEGVFRKTSSHTKQVVAAVRVGDLDVDGTGAQDARLRCLERVDRAWMGLHRDPETAALRPFDFSLKDVLPPYCIRIWTVPQARRRPIPDDEAYGTWRFHRYTDAQMLWGLHGQQAFDVMALDSTEQIPVITAVTESPIEATVALRGSGLAAFGSRVSSVALGATRVSSDDDFRCAFNDGVLTTLGHFASVAMSQRFVGGYGAQGDPFWYTASEVPTVDELETIQTDKEAEPSRRRVRSAYTKALRMAHRWLAVKASVFGADQLSWFHERMVNPMERYERIQELVDACARGEETVLKDYLRRLRPFWVGF
jgi:hypothetical protein